MSDFSNSQSQQPQQEEVQGTPIRSQVQSQQQQQNQPKYAKREIKMIGYDDCGHCVDAEKFIKTELIPNSDVQTSFTKIIADSDEGKAIVEQKKLEVVPFVEECLIPTNPQEKPDCREFKHFKKSNLKTKVNE